MKTQNASIYIASPEVLAGFRNIREHFSPSAGGSRTTAKVLSPKYWYWHVSEARDLCRFTQVLLRFQVSKARSGPCRNIYNPRQETRAVSILYKRKDAGIRLAPKAVNIRMGTSINEHCFCPERKTPECYWGNLQSGRRYTSRFHAFRAMCPSWAQPLCMQ